MGYVASETVVEYAVVDGNLAAVKKKVCKKDVPPDLAALKLLMSERGEELTPQELEAEKLRLLKQLKEFENETGKIETQDEMRNGGVRQ